MASVNLVKYKDEMLKAWEDVVSDKNPTNWALFTYDGQSYDLKYFSKGDGGISELADELNSSKIMYGVCKVMDPKTSLPKFVLINWQGESTPAIRKGTCANHLVAVQQFFKGIHVTVNARTEEEVDEEAITDKVAKSSGSAYNFKKIESREDESPSRPVGTTYKRVNPNLEINAKARDNFWAQEEEAEKKRQLEERRRKEEERKRREEELKTRELEGSRAREQQVLARMRSISELRQAEEKADKTSQEEQEKTKWLKQKQDDDNDEEERRMRSEMLRRQRNNEAQTLIKQRSIDARAVFEQHTSAGQLSNSRRSSSSNLSSPSPTPNSATKVSSKWPPSPSSVSPAPTSPTPTPPTPVVQSTSVPTNFHPNNKTPEPARSPVPLNNRHESPTPAIIVPPAPDFADVTPTHHVSSPVEDPITSLSPVEEPITSPSPVEEPQTLPSQVEEPKTSPSPAVALLLETNGFHENYVDETDDNEWESAPDQVEIPSTEVPAEIVNESGSNDFGVRARALYDYQAGEPGEISFDPGHIITHIDQIDEGWWQGLGPDGTYGLFPANYVELIE